jgi:hypothetical protein
MPGPVPGAPGMPHRSDHRCSSRARL